MAKKKVVLKRSLFIGLGGTGAEALLNTKKRFLDTYGEIPPMIDFLVIDTDQNIRTKSVEREKILVDVHKDQDKKVKLKASEVLYSSVTGAKLTYHKHKAKLFSWLPLSNEHVLDDMLHGAGQVRTNGRFAIFFNRKEIINTVQDKINNITDIKIADDSKFEAKGEGIEINFVFSVAGGTGSGSFTDVAYLVKEALKDNELVTMIGFLVLPDVFNAMQKGIAMQNTEPNGFGALMDLDYLMQHRVNDFGLNIKFDTSEIKIDSNPFHIVFTISNKNTSGDTVSHIKDISEQIGLAMFTGSSELSANIDSAYDNVKKVLAGGSLNIEGKRAWACGMGVSELVYDGNVLGNIFARRATAAMIDNLLNVDSNAQRLANLFIDNPEVKIRENDGNDYLIDSLLSPRPSSYFPGIEDVINATNMVSSYLESVNNNAKKTIELNYDSRLKDITAKLQEEVNSIVNNNNGVGNVKAFLKDLLSQLRIFDSEMIQELQELNEKRSNVDLQIESGVSNLQALSSGFSSILKSNQINNAKKSLVDLVNSQANNIHEIFRREFAHDFFTAVIKLAEVHLDNIRVLENRLKNAHSSSVNVANDLSNSASDKNKVFVIDLHKEDLNDVYIDKEDYEIKDFIGELNLANGIYDMYKQQNEDVEHYFWKYSKELSKTLHFVNKSIDDVLRDYSEEKRKEIASNLLTKSKALWQWNTQGFTVGHNIYEGFVIGLSNRNATFRKSFDGLIDAGETDIDFVATGTYNKITCYRMEAAMPIFGVGGVTNYEKEYYSRMKIKDNINYHIDNNWYNKMKDVNFQFGLLKEKIIVFLYGYLVLHTVLLN